MHLSEHLRWSGPSDVLTTLSAMHKRGWLVDAENDRLVHLEKGLFIPGDSFFACLRTTDPRITFSTGVEFHLEHIALPIPA
jgi:hypothetical protein